MMLYLPPKKDCCGCSACGNVCPHNAIKIEPDEEGFLYPRINDDNCINCGLCSRVCPVLSRDKRTKSPTYKAIYACRIKDANILFRSSSGGAFSAIALKVLELGGVVVGASYSPSMEVCHTIIDNEKDLDKIRGSKYVQSNLNNIFIQIRTLLKEGKLVLFSGTPCQVDGLRHFLLKVYENLITVDLVCHAVASPRIFHDYVEYINKRHGAKLVRINMRDKEKRGWGHMFSQRIIFDNEKEFTDSYKIIGWNFLYFSQYINRPSCNNCRYCNLDRPGDFTISDLWDDNNTMPSFKSNSGSSMMMLNTERALDLFKGIELNINYCPISLETVMQPNLMTPTPLRSDRDVFWAYYYEKGFLKSYTRFFKNRKSIISGLKGRVKYFLQYIYQL